MGKHKDEDKVDAKDVAQLPTYQPDRPTPYDKATAKPAPVDPKK